MSENIIGLNIKYLRQKKGIKQKHIAEKLEINSPQQIGKYERGEALPPLSAIYLIAELFEVSPGDLIEKDLSKGTNQTLKEPIQEYKIMPLIEALRTEQEKYKQLVQEIKQTKPELAKELGLM